MAIKNKNYSKVDNSDEQPFVLQSHIARLFLFDFDVMDAGHYVESEKDWAIQMIYFFLLNLALYKTCCIFRLDPLTHDVIQIKEKLPISELVHFLKIYM